MTKDKSIFIKNIYYMLSYAFQTLNQENYEDVAAESFDEMYDLLAAILAKGIGIQLKQGLYREYINRQEELPVMRGKINLPGTIKNRLVRKQLLTCDYDELSENNLLNQIIKTAVMLLLRNAKVKAEYKDDLKKKMLFFSDVDKLEPTSIRWSSIRFQRNNQTYRMLISICQLIIEGMLITTDAGEYRLASFVDEQRMCRLYEKFILEYYSKHFPELSVSASQIPWSVDDGIRTMLPVMQSDIHLQKGNTVLIIDAKYYSHTTQTQYDKHTLHSNNMYQIFTYVENRDYEFGDEDHKVSGMLLYAKTEEEIQPDNVYQMHGNQITVRTLDLNLPFSDIAKQLNTIAETHFDLPERSKGWESFAEEVKTKNRFFPESELLKKISDIAEKATCTISKGDILYRARDYTKQDFFKNDMVIALSEIMKDEFSNLEFDATDIFNESAMNIASIYLCGDEEKRRRITEKIDNLLNNKKDFYGFDKSNSDAPPNAYAKEGRANPKGISYLYTAKDIKTAILEMRPQMQKMYNIATIEIIRDAKIFDFTYSPEKIKEDEYSIVADLQRISEEFSKPNFGEQIEYAPTQFLCEYIKRLGFDGIKFKSAVSATGTNVLLFDVDAKTRVYDITGSKVYTVNTLDIDISQVMPMENEDKEQSQMLFICYPKCSTCQKAKKWLDEHNIKYTERHIVEVNPTYDELKEWYGKSGLTLKKFFNTSGLLYKEMQLKDKLPTMSEEEQIQLLATNGMLVKRPLVVNGDTVLVGFKEAEWAEKLN